MITIECLIDSGDCSSALPENTWLYVKKECHYCVFLSMIHIGKHY